ncbi:MAG: transcription-repair coupling factor, partial [Chloroflexota bacterium]
LRAARPLMLAALARSWDGPIIFITPRIKRAYNVVEQLPVWLGGAANPVLRFYEPIPQFYERASWGDDVIRGRVETLATLMDDSAPTQPVVVTSARALMQRTIPTAQFRKETQQLRAGQQHHIDRLMSSWLQIGYRPEVIVVEPGTFSRRGGVVDIFPAAASQPVRLDFFGDEIESIRVFDPSTQRSEGPIAQVAITPAREALPGLTEGIARHLSSWFGALPNAEADMTAPGADAEPLAMGSSFPHLEHYLPYMYANPVSLLDYAPLEALIVVEEWEDLQTTVEEITENAEVYREEQHATGQIPSDYPRPYLDWDMLAAELAGRSVLQLAGADTIEEAATLSSRFTPGGRFGGQLRTVLQTAREHKSRQDSVIIVTEQAERLKQLWYEQDTSSFIPTVQSLDTAPEPGVVMFVNGTMQEGWTFKTDQRQRIHVYTDAEIFGWSRPEPRRRKTTRRSRPPEADYADWKDGDYVVHVDYGIGRFGGMVHRTVEGNEREYLLVRYDGADMLFVPIHQADRLSRYIGADDTPPQLNKLGKPDWQRVRSRTQKAVEEEAQELLALYAARAQASGHAYTPDTHWQHELEASFSYVETEDQLRALGEVKRDMELPHPMDRLICGDVGYGKTEVALRAAFKAVMDGKQVAVLVPTTVLAQQHYVTFTNRMAPFPVKVEVMSRFRTREEQTRILPRIASGEIDILIGTHRILSQDITFKDLGLVIVDEEQRFGVKQKEHLKALRTQVDVLTLTATPIPRTLYMSMAGVRDISMIQTPPEERLPVITHVGRFDENLMRQAILREIERGGQVFIVHNRVRTIETLQDQIESLVPEARLIVGHGQMNERELSHVMDAFARHDYDILLSTTIVESGIDIPNANTLIVDRADQMGLAQLYQLRGRVGRSAQQGYAYFFHPRKVTPEARARLETLTENTSLGAGFNIAMRDLEIRGAGDILSTRQTGHVSAVGLNLYTQLLSQAIKKLKGEEPDGGVAQPAVATRGIVIDLPMPAYVPKDWIPEIALRLQIYRRIAGLTERAQIETMRAELLDRFGQLPLAVENLLYQIEVKLAAQAARATHIMARDHRIEVRLPYLGEINRPALEQLLGDDVEVSRVAVTFPQDDEMLWRLHLLDILDQLAEGVRAEAETSSGL